ncbi:hypothetical protein NQ317_016952 [Molorchus minor]|uniref:Uncharacterized protein n=1 Tax=Molorchus minor TaxID=1323400 RepID=A0ABQ9K385_9CUCU|nr:hypothetical protein NQ317_016952 [Molorchus minor]
MNLNEEIKNDLLKRKVVMEKAREELPYTFSLPETYESLQKSFENQSSTHQFIIMERMIKCNHPSLAEGNKDDLGLLFAYLLQHLNDLFSDTLNEQSIKNSFDVFKTLTPQLFDLAQFNPENTHNSILEVLKEKQSEFRKKRKEYPGIEVLIFFEVGQLLVLYV